jgi:DNA-binding transcriptional LysR family regulator
VEIQTMLSLVAAGIGVSIVPKCVGNLQRKDVVFPRLTGVRARTKLLQPIGNAILPPWCTHS